MTVTKTDLAALEAFQKELENYQKLAILVYRVYNHRDYPSDDEINSRVENEKVARRKINGSFGKLEQLIYNLLGGKPLMQVPAISGYQWDVFAEAFSSNFRSSSKGDCLNMAVDAIDRAVGRAAGLVQNKKPETAVSRSTKVFDDELLKKIPQQKVRELCKEFNNVCDTSPNAGALLFRTILLITLQHKLGSKAKEDLSDVLNQVVSGNIYSDKQVIRILKDLQGIPKTLLDATYHSNWILINNAELQHWAQGLQRVLLATFI